MSDKKFNYNKAVEDLYDAGCCDPEEVFEYKSEKGIRGFMGEHGLSTDKYYSGGHSGGGNSSGVGDCYLTTACVMAKGLPDDCDDLETLRRFRDGYLANTLSGKADIKHYYDVAPRIVEIIDRLPDAREVWKQVYSELVEPCVRLIKKGRNEETYAHYKQYALYLYDEYVGA